MDELTLIRKLAARGQRLAGVVRGIGDDCAILRVPKGHELLVHTDLTIEDVHFRRRAFTPQAIGAKAIARVVSDVAAMGGVPRWALLSVVLRKNATASANAKFLDRFYDGVFEVAGRFGLAVVGGDTSRGAQFVADAVVLGSCPRGSALRRDTARTGDGIYVSGSLGHAAASQYLEIPEPRLALGQWLRGKATAVMDLSDGLALDLHRLAWESNLAAELHGPLPISPGATSAQALSGGEDYELLFTSSRSMPVKWKGLPITRIGTMTAGPRGRVWLDGRPLKPAGWDPLRKK